MDKVISTGLSLLIIFILTLLTISCRDDGNDLTGPRQDVQCIADSKDLYPDQAASLYVLPWSIGETYLVTQGNCTNRSHRVGLNQQFAYDFGMPLGTIVHAAREGVVIVVEERYRDGTKIPGQENYVSILHNDNTVARYVHLTIDGALVAEGDTVEQGQMIGISGNSGNSTGPHLHFDVMDRNCAPQFIDCHSLPTTFLNTTPHPQGLLDQVEYAAEPY